MAELKKKGGKKTRPKPLEDYVPQQRPGRLVDFSHGSATARTTFSFGP
jgi:hypothetical protein